MNFSIYVRVKQRYIGFTVKAVIVALLNKIITGRNDYIPLIYATSSFVNSAASIMSMCSCYLYVNKIIRNRSDILSYQLKYYIDGHFLEKLSISTICSRFYVSKSKLYSISKDIFGMGVTNYIRTKRIEFAKEQLLCSTKPILQIAEQTGFPTLIIIYAFLKNTKE